MSVIATFEVAGKDFILGDVLESRPALRVRVEQVVPTDERVIPYLWASAESVEAVETALRAAMDVESFQVVEEIDGDVLVRVAWRAGLDGLLDAIADTSATVFEAVGEGGHWSLTVRFDTREALSAFYQRCADLGIPLDVVRVHGPDPPGNTAADFGLTETQRQTLQFALDAGYFDVPRGTNLVDLATDLGISDTAVSQRLRRGIATVLRATL